MKKSMICLVIGNSIQSMKWPYLAMYQYDFLGDVSHEDWQENDLSIKEGFRILSVYVVANGRFLMMLNSNPSSNFFVIVPFLPPQLSQHQTNRKIINVP